MGISDITDVGDLHRLLDTRLTTDRSASAAALAAARRLLDLVSVTTVSPN